MLAGDLFASEDRLGTWKTVLTRSCTRREVFIGKVLAAGTYALVMAAGATVSSVVAGVLVTGDQPLVGFGGTLVSPATSLALVLTGFLLCVPPLLAFVGIAVLFSVATRSGIMGVLGPLLVAMAMQLLGLIGNGSWVHLLLVSSAFEGWHGLFTTPAFFGPLVIGLVVSAGWFVACVGVAWLLIRRRDITGPSVSRRPGWVMPARMAGTTLGVLALLAVASGWGPSAITAPRLRAALTPEFNNLTILQQRELGRRIPTGAHLTIVSFCTRRAGASTGPGDDWACTLNVYIPQPGAVPFEQTPVTYDVSVQSNGCYKATAPPSFVGQQMMRAANGRSVVNPLFTIYGCFNII